jgi:hypothetical protein
MTGALLVICFWVGMIYFELKRIREALEKR